MDVPQIIEAGYNAVLLSRISKVRIFKSGTVSRVFFNFNPYGLCFVLSVPSYVLSYQTWLMLLASLISSHELFPSRTLKNPCSGKNANITNTYLTQAFHAFLTTRLSAQGFADSVIKNKGTLGEEHSSRIPGILQAKIHPGSAPLLPAKRSHSVPPKP